MASDTDALQSANLMDRFTWRLQGLLLILIASWSVLSGCADTKQKTHADSNAVFRQSENDTKVHGEVGVLYGHTAR
jgi:hypothetical protein